MSSPCLIQVKAVYSWRGEQPDDLGFVEGDIIEVVNYGDGNWWFGRLKRNKMMGHFPSNYVEELESQTSPTSGGMEKVGSTFSLNYERASVSNVSSPPVPPKKKLGSELFIKEPAPYDPETLRISIGSNIFPASNQSQLKYSTLSNETGASSFLGHSDLSATSAGSFIRHRAKKDYMEESMQNKLVDQIFEDKNCRHPNIFKKMFSKKEIGPTLDTQILESGFHTKSQDSYNDTMGSIHRAATINPKERAMREHRALNEENHLILKPYRAISSINTNEILHSPQVRIDLMPLYHVDKFMRSLPLSKVSTLEQVAREAIGRFKSDIEKLRGTFIFCTERFSIAEPHAREHIDIPPNFDDIMLAKRCTPYQAAWMFKKMCQVLGIKVDLVVGHFKYPFSDDLQPDFPLNHLWIAVLVDGEWRLVDPALGNVTHPIHQLLNNSEKSHEPFYFLAKPLHLIYTHVPRIIEQQHIVPPIDTNVALVLPSAYPAFVTNSLRVFKCNAALLRLVDFEVAEIDLEIPRDVEAFANVVTAEVERDALCQIYWKNNLRFVKIKATLPPKTPMGRLCVYAGGKGQQKSLGSIHPLALSVPVYHRGKYRKLELVTRYPTPLAQAFDFYVKEPQVKRLTLGSKLLFTIKQYPANGVWEGGTRASLRLQSPSGRTFKMGVDETLEVSRLHVDICEPGTWSGLVMNDDAESWSVFSQWECE